MDEEVSIGDFVLTGGEIPAMAVIDAVARLLPGVLSSEESFSNESHYDSLLEYPQYTRPPEFRGRAVPEVLLSGHHKNIEEWRRKESIRRTYLKRPDMLENAQLTEKESCYLEELKEDFKMDMTEKTIDSKILFEGKIIRLRYDTVRLPNGKEAGREIIEHPGGVGIIAVDEKMNVLMVRQYRRPFDRLCLEIPAGKLNYGEEHYDCGVRELEEETGVKAGRFEYLGVFYPSPGFCKEVLHLYLATELVPGKPHLDEDEFLEVETYPLSKLVEMVMNGEIHDGKTILAILMANEKFRQEGHDTQK